MSERTILVGEYGSVAQGTATPDSDHDYMAIYMETPEEVIGLETASSDRVSDAKDGEKSAPGSSDTTFHSLRRFCKLAAAGNPTLGSILFLPRYEKLERIGEFLLDNADAFVSKKAGQAYLGYMDAQIKAFAETGRKNRVELVEKYGYDIKFAYHAYRLGVQGWKMMTNGVPPIPLTGPSLRYARNIRAGYISKDDTIRTLSSVRENLRDSIDSSSLPDYPDTGRINSFLVTAHNEYWSTHRML